MILLIWVCYLLKIINSDLTIEGSLDLQKNLQVNANEFVFGKLEVGGTIKARELEVSTQWVS